MSNIKKALFDLQNNLNRIDFSNEIHTRKTPKIVSNLLEETNESIKISLSGMNIDNHGITSNNLSF